MFTARDTVSILATPVVAIVGHYATAARRTRSSAAAAVGASAMIRTIGSVLLPRTISQRSGQSSRRPSSRSAWASAKCRCDGVEGRRQLLRRQAGRSSCDLVARQLVGQLADLLAAAGHGGQDQRHADEAVAHQADARIDRPAVPFAAEDRADRRASYRRRSPRRPPSDGTARRTSPPGPRAMRLVAQLVTTGPFRSRSTWSRQSASVYSSPM